MKTINRDIVAAVILSKDKKILMGKKDPKKGGVYKDCWHIPGGGIDEGEDFITALKREVLEETGLDLENLNAQIELLDDKGSGESTKVLASGEKFLCKMIFYVYKVSLNNSATELQLVATDDLVELRWVGIQELDSLKLTPPSIELFSRLQKGLLF